MSEGIRSVSGNSSYGVHSGHHTRHVNDRSDTSGSSPAQSSRSPWGEDSVSFSPEAASELAAVDPSRCNNNWRCLDQLRRRGLLEASPSADT